MVYNSNLMGNEELFEKKFSILQDISGAMVTTDNIATLSNLMLDLAINYSNAEKGSIMILNAAGELTVLAARGIDIEFLGTYRTRIGEGIAGIVAETCVPVLVNDIDTDERFRDKKRDRYRTRSFISCPIMIKSRLLGILNINDKKDSTEFTEDEFELVKIIANQAAAAIENASLMSQLKTKASEFEEINRKLIEMDVMKSEFFTRISHDLRTPLHSIAGSIHYLRKSSGTVPQEEQEDFLKIVSDEVGKLSTLIENLLDFLRLEDETRIMKKSIISPIILLKEVIDSKFLKNILEKKNLKLKTSIEKSISDVVVDKERVVQFFFSIIDGLSHYLENGDNIEFTAHQNEVVKITISVSRKLPEEVIPYFYDARHIYQSQESNGRLKFYLARRIAELHHWKLDARNEEESFVISLSISKSALEKRDAILATTTEMFIDLISEALGLDVCSVMLADELTGELKIKGSKGLSEDIVLRTRVKVGDQIAGWVALEGKPLFIEDLDKDPRFGKRSISQYNTRSLLSLPLRLDDKVIGVLNLNNKKSALPFTAHDYYISLAMSDRFSHFIKKVYEGGSLESDSKQFLTSFENLLSAEKRYFKKGGLAPSLVSKMLDKLSATEEEKKAALYVSVIYDLGLMSIDEEIMKKRKLASSEMRSIKVHPYTTIDLLSSFEFSDDVKKAILHHHERYDGTGYPGGLAGEDIPFISRVIAVVDTFCALIEDRPYHDAITKSKALAEIKNGAGSRYDPKVVAALEEVFPKLPE
ncbi:MAG TPA: HD domain-containing phosphohydrolase [Candidatus Sulfobium mesophilum]|nr:HD domain-containing phosphohydrolase [Candidatus Sulfobium mesophilum]